MAEKTYFRKLGKGTKEFNIVTLSWELMKLADTKEYRFMLKRIFEAFCELDGDIEEIRTIWTEWWVIFQTFYENDGSEEYWENTYDQVNAFNEKYRNTDKNKIVLKLSTMIMDFQQIRSELNEQVL